MILFPNCKINLGLHITRKREDGFHDLQTVFYPLPITDALEIISSSQKEKDIEFNLTGATIDGGDNICIKAYQLLKKDFPQLTSIQMHLHKTIPIGAGLGGGSADGAFTLLLLNKKYGLQLTKKQLIHYALQLGSDCPFFIKNTPCIAGGRGEELEEIQLDLSPFKIVIVNPGVHINTGWAFRQLTPKQPEQPLADVIQKPVAEWKDFLTNDFEAPIFNAYPEVKAVKEKLYAAGAVYASMSGSGSTVFGLFHKTQNVSFSFPQSYFVKEYYL
ncbi:MAG: 4-(cytidine 5'-diphospho)-2-C-methyl-D-erythritol kinase [Chitinophagaceae bacterium]